ncbi:MAG: hypothetical protein NTZ10_02065 [Candidatus Saganbacteria bacterium]|nr:hypothetical protein [Candidatus Saganbacteria bacterium]
MQIILRVLTPLKKIFEGSVDSVSLEAADGSLGVLPGHAPLAAQLRRSKIVYHINGSASSIDIDGGLAKIMPDIVTVFAKNNA